MTTIINTPPTVTTEDSSAGMVLGIIFGALIVIALLFFGVRYYRGQYPASSSGQPASQSTLVVPGGGTTVNVTSPATPSSANSGTSVGY